MVRDCHIEISNLDVTFNTGQAVLSDVNLSCERGEFVGIIGPSGCGKSTLLRCVAGLQSPTGGTLDVRSADSSSAQIAYVFQESTLLKWRSAAANVALPLELAGVATAERSSRVEQSLQLAGLHAPDFRKRPFELSGGMQMRVSLARAIVTQPELLLLDEPFAAIDDISRQQLNNELQRLWLAQNWTAMFVTHNVAEAAFLSSRVLVMSQHPGRILADVEVDFEFPRPTALRTNPDFANLCGELTSLLEQASSEAVS